MIDQASMQSLRRSYTHICQGEEPWIALGMFMHQFFGERRGHQDELLSESILLPEKPTGEQMQWAIFCAASAEYLSNKYSLECPPWAHDPAYRTVEQPWYHGLGADRARVQEKLRMSTPPEFARRNIFCGERVYANKYEPSRVRRTA